MKPFTWSYSQLVTFQQCPKKYYEITVMKKWKESSKNLDDGNAVHLALANRIEKAIPLPSKVGKHNDVVIGPHYERWVQEILDKEPDKILVENKLAITRAYAPTTYFANDVWMRGIADVIKIKGEYARVYDWKTGKPKENDLQLALMAGAVFAHYPNISAILAQFVWLAEPGDTRGSRSLFKRSEMPAIWANQANPIATMEHAYNTTTFPATPNALCGWCSVKDCPHNPKRDH